MLEFIRRNRLFLTSGLLLCASLLLLSISLRTRPYRDPIARVLLDVLAPFQDGFTWLRHGVGDTWQVYVNLVGVRHENERLQDQIAALEARLVRLGELEASNRRLQRLLDLRERLDGTVYAARVIGRDPLPWFRTLTVDRGERDGIRRGLAVVSPRGVVGQIADVSRTAARVLLLTDHNSGIDAVVQRSRARGIVQGGREEGCLMNYLKRDDDVRAGDRVVTSGLDGIFPKGVLIGQVVEVETRNRGLLQAAVIDPSAPLDRIEEVLIIEATTRVRLPDVEMSDVR
jgi:rod shape-determining protein MreC